MSVSPSLSILPVIQLWIANYPRMPAKNTKPNVGKAYDLIEYFFILASTFHAIPFSYNKQNRRFEIRRGLYSWPWFLLQLVAMAVELCQMGWRLLEGTLDPNVSRAEWSLICFLAISWTLIWTCHVNVSLNQNEILNHVNQTVCLREWLARSGIPKSNDYKIVRAHICSSIVQCFFQSLMVATEGTRSHFLYSNVPLEYRTGATASLWWMYAYYRVASNFLSGYFQVWAGVLHVISCNQVLMVRSSTRMSFDDKLKSYRMLQMLTNRYGESYASIFVTEFAAFIAENFVIGIYGTVKFYDDPIGFSNYMNFPLMVVLMILLLFTLYPKYASLYEMTKDEPRNLVMAAHGLNRDKNNNSMARDTNRSGTKRMSISSLATDEEEVRIRDTKYVKSVARSVPVLGIPFGSLYKIKQSTVLTMFNFIACNSISIFITFP